MRYCDHPCARRTFARAELSALMPDYGKEKTPWDRGIEAPRRARTPSTAFGQKQTDTISKRRSDRLEELYDITRRIEAENLSATETCQNVVLEPHTILFQSGNQVF